MIEIEDGRVNSIEIEAGDASGASTLVERVSLTFNKIAVTYVPQGGDGRSLGSTQFSDQWSAAT
jgi:type VI protein secretion system component Hcp